MKKSVISALCSAVLFVMFSVNAFAEVPYHPLPGEPLINVEDGDTVIGTLKTLELKESSKAYLREWLSSTNNLCVYDMPIVNFIILGNDFKSNGIFSADSRGRLTLDCKSSGYTFHISSLAFNLTTGELQGGDNSTAPNGMGFHIGIGGSSGLIDYPMGYVFSGSYFNSVSVPFTNASLIDYEGRLLLRDDGGIFGDEVPPVSSSEPDKPPDFNPEPPTEPFVPPSAPSFDFGGTTGDLPYDSSIWEALMWYLRDTIGSVGTVLLWVMMIIIAIPTVMSAIRHFMNQAGGDGDNTSGLI